MGMSHLASRGTVCSLGLSLWGGLQGFRAAVKGVDTSVSLTVSPSGHHPPTLLHGLNPPAG